MAETLAKVTLTGEWVDLVVERAAIDGVAVMIQNRTANSTLIVFGGGEPDDDESAISLGYGQAVQGTSDHIWAKGNGPVSITILDA